MAAQESLLQKLGPKDAATDLSNFVLQALLLLDPAHRAHPQRKVVLDLLALGKLELQGRLGRG